MFYIIHHIKINNNEAYRSNNDILFFGIIVYVMKLWISSIYFIQNTQSRSSYKILQVILKNKTPDEKSF